MSDAMNNPYANNPNQNGSNGQQPQGQPEYGAYAPNQQSQSQQQGGNPNNSGNPYQSEPQTPCYFDGPNANPNPKCERQIQMPPKNIQRIFIST